MGFCQDLAIFSAFLIAKSNPLRVLKGNEYSFPKATKANKLPAAGNRGSTH